LSGESADAAPCSRAGLRYGGFTVRRFLALILLLALLGPGTWLREKLPPEDNRDLLHFERLADPPPTRLADRLGPFRLQGVWRMDNPLSAFGSFSALDSLGDGTLLAISDRGVAYRFSPPGAPPTKPWMDYVRRDQIDDKRNVDAEAVTVDPMTGTFWVAWEDGNAISRHAGGMTQLAIVRPRSMADWGDNSGPEAMVRLNDGSFIVLREGFESWTDRHSHRGLRFATDPTESQRHIGFTFDGPDGFSPTEMTQLPDGRVLVLLRRLVWPFPARFALRIVLVDPTDIRPGRRWQSRLLARLGSDLPVDNFEGMAVEPRPDGKYTVWLISDDNDAALQRTMLWKLELDPVRLPVRSHQPSKRARELPSTRPSADQR